MCGKTHVLLYLRECIAKDLSEKGIMDYDKFFDEYSQKYDIDMNRNLLIY